VLDPVPRFHGDASRCGAYSSVGVRHATGGSSPSTVGSSSKMGAPSILPWMKRMSEQKELSLVLHTASISFGSMPKWAMRTMEFVVLEARPQSTELQVSQRP
jgi:hypothetical protein